LVKGQPLGPEDFLKNEWALGCWIRPMGSWMHFPKLGCGMIAAWGMFSLIDTTGAAQSSSAKGDMTAQPQIVAALRQVSAQRIQQDVEKLASFGTRLTLSAQDPDSIAAGHGIGAAREWIR
jgi:hypothetical protein